MFFARFGMCRGSALLPAALVRGFESSVTYPDFAWKTADKRLLAIECFHSARLLIKFANSILAVQHAYELDHSLQQLATCTAGRAEDYDLTAK